MLSADFLTFSGVISSLAATPLHSSKLKLELLGNSIHETILSLKKN